MVHTSINNKFLNIKPNTVNNLPQYEKRITIHIRNTQFEEVSLTPPTGWFGGALYYFDEQDVLQFIDISSQPEHIIRLDTNTNGKTFNIFYNDAFVPPELLNRVHYILLYTTVGVVTVNFSNRIIDALVNDEPFLVLANEFEDYGVSLIEATETNNIGCVVKTEIVLAAKRFFVRYRHTFLFTDGSSLIIQNKNELVNDMFAVTWDNKILEFFNTDIHIVSYNFPRVRGYGNSINHIPNIVADFEVARKRLIDTTRIANKFEREWLQSKPTAITNYGASTITWYDKMVAQRAKMISGFNDSIANGKWDRNILKWQNPEKLNYAFEDGLRHVNSISTFSKQKIIDSVQKKRDLSVQIVPIRKLLKNADIGNVTVPKDLPDFALDSLISQATSNLLSTLNPNDSAETNLVKMESYFKDVLLFPVRT